MKNFKTILGIALVVGLMNLNYSNLGNNSTSNNNLSALVASAAAAYCDPVNENSCTVYSYNDRGVLTGKAESKGMAKVDSEQ